MGEAIITRRGGSGSGGSGEVIVEFESFTPSNTVRIFHPDGELVRSTPTVLSVARERLAGASVGDYALFAGGYNGSYMDAVDAYDVSLVRSTPTALSVMRSNLAGASVGNYALFAGGYGSSPTYKDTVDAYDASLVRSTPTVLSVARRYLAGASVGDYALFAGSYGVGYSDVDAYTPQISAARLYMPVGTKYKFGATEETAASVEITVPTPVTGYVKFKNGVIRNG